MWNGFRQFHILCLIEHLKKGGKRTMYMLKYILKRLGLLLMTFVIIEIICFVLIKSLPIVINVPFGKRALVILSHYQPSCSKIL